MSKKKQKGRVKSIIFIFSLAILCLIGVYVLNYLDKEYHVHADFKVYINGEFMNFSADRYQSEGLDYLHESAHLHNGDGDVIHHHEKGITLSEFFDSINYTLEEPITIYVNNKQIDEGLNYIFKDLDQILIISNSNDYELDSLLKEITDKACIQSGICPERGEPYEGGCFSGETCVVDVTQFE